MYRKLRAGAVVVGAALLVSACSSGGDKKGGDGSAPPVTQQPKSSDPFWVNPDSKAAQAVSDLEKDGKDDDAQAVRKIAEQPSGEWLIPENAEDQARGYTEAAQKADRDALLVIYNIPHRDCGNYSQGGAADGDAYRTFIDQVAAGIGDRPATIILEPDAVQHMVDNCTPEQFHEERYDLLNGAIEKFKSLKATKVYLDAGNAGWGTPDQLYDPLQRSGIGQADGFALNVSNFYSTEDSVKYGKELSAKVGNKPFVIDTSRNGNGPYTGGDPDERWCNPPGRALGEAPTTKTGDDLVKAYLWVKRPGESDGTCKGGPKAGEWWGEYAVKLAEASN
ncbi:endoglucanase [Streptomyces sp. SID8379]|uniref:glycoside hydrolase family 6 protein n=1 Tax=unclassified Streptomyces TaxID=2593676 RepID=UPI0003A854E2|nr:MULTISPECIES: glycoside hydrolase family 6 protein [unclassified Streptomyces]MYW66019.1 endoglucanase [Streptomyces sp. SID8379]